MDDESFALVLLAVAKWVTYAGLVGLTGAVAIRRLLDPPAGAAESAGGGVDRQGGAPPAGKAAKGAAEPAAASVERRVRALAAASAAALLAGAAARLYAQTWSVFGLDEPVTPELVRVIAVESRWAAGWRPQAAFAVLAALAAAGWRLRPRAGWWLLAFAAAGAWVTLPLTGHAMSAHTRAPWLLQAAHGIGAGLWIGTLAALVAAAGGIAERPQGHRRVADLVGRFSPLALAAVGSIAVTGVLTAALYVGGVADAETTGYGRVLLGKVLLFLAAGAVGAYNWRRLTPRLGNEAGTRALLRSARLELALAAGVLAATAVLVHLAMPGEME